MENTVEIRLNADELKVLRSGLDSESKNLEQELEDSMDSSSDSEIIEIAGKLQAAQAAKYKLDVHARAHAGI